MQPLIDSTSSRPAYQQLVDHVKREVALGRFLPGERLPTVRELAAQLILNPNTIARAYRLLEHEGIITTRPGAGAFVADSGSRLGEEVQRHLVTTQFEHALVDGLTMGRSPETLHGWFDETLSQFLSQSSPAGSHSPAKESPSEVNPHE